jgi:hypothetical protein
MSDAIKRAGAPKKLIYTIEEVEKLCRLNCTDSELAAYYNVCRKTIEREKNINPAFKEAVQRGHDFGRLSLRRKQVELANDGNVTMLIWLGKQYLGQKDKSEQEHSGSLEIHAIEYTIVDEAEG